MIEVLSLDGVGECLVRGACVAPLLSWTPCLSFCIIAQLLPEGGYRDATNLLWPTRLFQIRAVRRMRRFSCLAAVPRTSSRLTRTEKSSTAARDSGPGGASPLQQTPSPPRIWTTDGLLNRVGPA